MYVGFYVHSQYAMSFKLFYRFIQDAYDNL